tara:strand:+ start:12165 stop:14072 length:1908 start_codon:yes stop_codon:yes gene_type:complete
MKVISLPCMAFFLSTLSTAIYAIEQSEENSTETITIFYNKSIKSLDESRTSDDVMIYPEQVASAPHTVGDIIAQSTGVTLNGQGGLFQSYNIRGFSRARIKTEVDGIAIITDRRAGNSASFLPTELISSVTIQKGPQSTLYGSGAMGGIVSISTQTHDQSALGVILQPQDNAQHIWARFNGDTVNASIIHRQADHAKSASDDSTPGNELNSQYQQKTATISTEITWQNIDIFVSAIVSQGDDIGKSSGTYPNERISSYPQDDHLLSQIEFSSSRHWKLKLYQHQQQWQTNILRLDDQQEISRRNLTDYQSNTYGAYGAWLVNNTTIGVEWFGRHNIMIGESEFTASNTLAWKKSLVDADEDTYSAYALHDWTIDKLTIAAGARYDKIRLEQQQTTKSDNFLSLSTDFFYQISAHSSASMQIANAFRFPSVSELFFSGETPRGNTQGNSELAPEQSIGLQFSFNHHFSDDFSTTFNAYHYKIDDYIARYTLDNVRYYRNSLSVTINGFELINHWAINQQWQTNIGLQWQQARDVNNNTVDDGIPKALKWSLNWQNEQFTIRQQLTYQFKGSDMGPSEQAQAGEIIWQVTGDYQVNEHVTLTLSVLNLTDNRYKASSDEDAAFQPERTVNISGLWRF